MNVAGAGAQYITPVFGSKVYTQAEYQAIQQEQALEAQGSMNRSQSQQSHSFLENQDISLSHHAYVQYNQQEEEKQVEISNSSFNRSNQQNHSTPIHNFRTLRSRDISVKNSQDCILVEERPRSDSLETEKGHPEHTNSNMLASLGF